jgi:hypothetical protein
MKQSRVTRTKGKREKESAREREKERESERASERERERKRDKQTRGHGMVPSGGRWTRALGGLS